MLKILKKFYFQKFKDKIFVIKIGGEVIKSKEILENIICDIKDIFDQGIKVILVHGGGSQADELSKALGHEPSKIAGRRVTQAKDLEVIKMLYGGSLNLDILSLMKKHGLKGLRVSGVDGNLLQVKTRSKEKHDFGFVGDIENVNCEILEDLIHKNYIPVISPIGCNEEGVLLNINADTIAKEIACAMQCDKLILFTNTDGVYSGKKLLKTLTPNECQNLIMSGVAKDGMAIKLQNCLEAITRKVKRIHILNGLSPHSLLSEILSQEGVGTMIISEKEKELYLSETEKKKPQITIIGSIHGDEKIGKKILDKLTKDQEEKKLDPEIQLIFGNPKAYELNQRFVDEDLNRLFGEKPCLSSRTPIRDLTYEQKRAEELKPFLQKTDFLLDIHCTIKKSVPFIYCENMPQHIKLAKIFETEYIVTRDKNFEAKDLMSSTDNYVDRHGGIGLTYEAGYINQIGLEEDTYAKVLKFIKTCQISYHPERHSELTSCHPELVSGSPSKILNIFQDIIPKTENFHFTKDWQNFDQVKKGEIIALDDKEKIVAEENCFIIFPKKILEKNQIACYLAKEINLKKKRPLSF